MAGWLDGWMAGWLGGGTAGSSDPCRLRPPRHAAAKELGELHAGESVESLIRNPAPGAPVPPILPPQDGFLLLDRAKFAAAFAADVDPEQSAFMADAQVPWGLGALAGAVSEPAWKSKPSWYLIATEDRMIPPAAQRSMAERAGATIAEAAGSHAIYVSQPESVAKLIGLAARETEAMATA